MIHRGGRGPFHASRTSGTPGSGAVTLGTITLDNTSWTNGTSASGSILGATTSSTLSISGQPTGFTINSGARTWAFDGTGAAGSGSFTLTETLAGATNTPHDNTISYTIAAGASSFYLLENGTDKFLLENGTDKLLME